jgi:hypothetical protein
VCARKWQKPKQDKTCEGQDLAGDPGHRSSLEGALLGGTEGSVAKVEDSEACFLSSLCLCLCLLSKFQLLQREIEEGGNHGKAI